MNRQRMWISRWGLAVGIGAFLIAAELMPVQAQEESPGLIDLPLEDLMQIEVSSVSRRSESLMHSAAAVFVLTQDDIRRSSARSIPQLLRLVPGLNVAQLDGNRWAISARGFNDVYSDKLLVLLDGRTLYNQLFSGVLWDSQSYPLEEIERIEVIRGPGATLWGANAVNGVINIITMRSNETPPMSISAGGGIEENGFGSVRASSSLGENGHLRLYGMYDSSDDNLYADDSASYDGSEVRQGGFRSDFTFGSRELTVQGDLYNNNSKVATILPIFEAPYQSIGRKNTMVRGGNLLTRYSERFTDRSELQLQFFVDHVDRSDVLLNFAVDTYDFDSQYRFLPSENHEFTIGLNYRYGVDDLDGRETLRFIPDSRGIDTVGGFIQDSIPLSDAVRLTLGTKYDHHEFVGSEFQPSARLAYSYSSQQTFWLAASRAARLPSRANNDALLHLATTPPATLGMPPTATYFEGRSDIASESVWTYELGHRIEVLPSLSFDTALFFNHYENLSTSEFETPALGGSIDQPLIVLPLLQDDKGNADVFGGEVVVNSRLTDRWRVQLWYALVRMAAWTDSSSTDPRFDEEGEFTPSSSAMVRSYLDLPYQLEFDTALRYVDKVAGVDLDPYLELDAKLGWRVNEHLTFSLNGINLLHSDHREYRSDSTSSPDTYIQRALYAKVDWRY